ncbi:MAG TPA: hypothetical protein VGB44_03500 [Flavobacterium sp.]|jgi:hypothetical protein
MKKLLFPVIVIAVLIAVYEQGKDRPNVYITIAAVVVFMFGMMKLSAKTPSKNQETEDDNV